MRILLNLIGLVAVALGVLGIFLPLLPTTPFLLLASACFMKSSPRLHQWMMNNRLFGEYLKNIQEKKGIPLRGKIVTLIVLWTSMGYSIYIVRPLVLKGLLITIGLCVSAWILHMKTLRRGPDQKM
ncbi:YbaN family protein [Noviherbaspirillum malthae]|uniref:YbaN family protein n=1 Tax=Noviherbaspirillum malthae TaxID=1260987 RepID=UPI001890B3D8|nr:YbaN family protein [Noviherbaspirillum malthae]